MAKRYVVGESARGTFTTTIAGVLTNATEVTLTITEPDGSTASYTLSGGTVETDTTGVYYKDVTLDTAGRWEWNWASTGDVTAADAGELLVSA